MFREYKITIKFTFHSSRALTEVLCFILYLWSIYMNIKESFSSSSNCISTNVQKLIFLPLDKQNDSKTPYFQAPKLH